MSDYVSTSLLDVYMVKQERAERIAAYNQARYEKRMIEAGVSKEERQRRLLYARSEDGRSYERHPLLPDPSLEEIAAMTAEIRKDWTPQEYHRRANFDLVENNDGYCTPHYPHATAIPHLPHPLTHEQRELVKQRCKDRNIAVEPDQEELDAREQSKYEHPDYEPKRGKKTQGGSPIQVVAAPVSHAGRQERVA